MNSEKILLKALDALGTLLQESTEAEVIVHKIDAFRSASEQCNFIVTSVKLKDIPTATSAWQALMYFTNDSIGGSESFQNRYQPLKQKIINARLQ